jgi:hypothetical protein
MALPTIFPQPLMLAATFDPQLAFQVRMDQQQQQQQQQQQRKQKLLQQHGQRL